jgi:HD-GYP domain-containing protein (c-di-GMP phosphodiesterase class II)
MASAEVKTRPRRPEKVAASPPAGAAPHKHFRIAVARLAQGMFVAELDRPWVDTPFLIQGFTIDSAIELETLRKYCRHVYVDLELSNPEVADAIREAENLSASDGRSEPARDFRSLSEPGTSRTAVESGRKTPRVQRVRNDKQITVSTRDRFREFIRSTSGVELPEAENESTLKRVLSKLSSLFRGEPSPTRARAAAKAARQAVQQEVLNVLPPGTRLTKYAEVRAVVEELPRARSSLAKGESILETVVKDVKSGTIPQVEKVQAAVDDMVESMIDNPDALMWVARLRDEDTNTYSHGVKVSLYMISLGRHLGFPKDQLAHLGMIGMLADVGKIKLPRALLEKPGMLSPAEHGIVKEHVRLGLEALTQNGPLPTEVAQGIAQHHERMDGTGYPKGLVGDEISIYGRIAGIADCFAALITSRSYANASAPQDALMNMYQWAGTSFHEALVEQFVQSVGVFPVGSLVELNSGEIAVVVAQNRVRRLEPKVLLLTWPDKRPLAHPIERDLFKNGKDASGKQLRIARGLPAGAYGLKLRDFYADSMAHANQLL